MARQRITEEFVKHLNLLKHRSGNSPYNIRPALDRDPQVANSIKELWNLLYFIDWHENHSNIRFIVQAHPDFSKALKDYRERWASAYLILLDWEAERAGQETLTALFERAFPEGILSKLADDKASSVVADEDDDWDFDPEVHSAATHIEWMADHIGDIANDEGNIASDEPIFNRAKGAWDWLVNTVGIDLRKIEEGWKEFPVLIIPDHVSNAHGLNEPKSLYSYLTDVRLAYIIGADLAAIAMCRAATEILIRCHYNNNPETKLIPLVKETLNRREFAFLRPLNLVIKIKDANNILHFKEDIKNSDRNRAIVRDWVDALRVMIDNAPRSREHTEHG